MCASTLKTIAIYNLCLLQIHTLSGLEVNLFFRVFVCEVYSKKERLYRNETKVISKCDHKIEPINSKMENNGNNLVQNWR